tara:strand:- start:360 stop:926 length:567 start_codon:yes stop_codon:yes gene_type:complete
MSGIVGGRNNRGSGLVANLGTDGQVLTSAGVGLKQVFEDAAVSSAGFTSGARVRCSGSTSINNASFTIVPFDTEVFDTDSDFDTTNNRFIVGTGDDGIFLFTTSIMFSNLTADKTMRLCWYINGALAEQTYHTTSNATTSGGTAQAIFDLAATNYVEVFVYHDGGGAETLSGSTATHLFFNIQKIGPA